MLREAQALARLNHPNVVTVHDAGLLPSGEVFVAALKDPDAGVAERAVQALRALGSVDACADAKTLASRLPPPSDPAVAARVEDLRARLTRIQAAVDAGRYEEMLGPARDLDRDAVATGHAPFIAEAHSLLGRVLILSGDNAEAEAVLQDAIAKALALGSTYANLAVVEMRRGNFSRASTLFEQGSVAFAQGLPPEHPTLGQLHASMAEVSLALGDLVSARRHADATEPARTALPAGDEGRFTIDAAHVRVLLAAGDADAAMRLARRHHEDVASSDAAAPLRAGADVLLALALALVGDEQAAMLLAEETIARLGEAGADADATHLLMAHVLLGRLAGDASRACDHFGAAHELLRAHVTLVSPDEKAAITQRAERCAS